MQAIDLLENRVRSVIQKLNTLENENQLLRHELDQLKEYVSGQKKDNMHWKEKYQSLLVAETLQGGNNKNVKLTISNLIKEIDSCIALLNP